MTTQLTLAHDGTPELASGLARKRKFYLRGGAAGLAVQIQALDSSSVTPAGPQAVLLQGVTDSVEVDDPSTYYTAVAVKGSLGNVVAIPGGCTISVAAESSTAAGETGPYTNGGDAFGAEGVLGTLDANDQTIIANGVQAIQIDKTTRNVGIGPVAGFGPSAEPAQQLVVRHDQNAPTAVLIENLAVAALASAKVTLQGARSWSVESTSSAATPLPASAFLIYDETSGFAIVKIDGSDNVTIDPGSNGANFFAHAVFCEFYGGSMSINPGASPGTPDASAILDLQGVSGGFLTVRMTSAERTGLASPATALQVFDTTLNVPMTNVGTSGSPVWQPGKSGQVGAITAGTTRTQGGATVLTRTLSRVDTSTAPAAGSTLGDGVALFASYAGAEAIVENNTPNPIQLYGHGADTINGVAGPTGIAIPPGAQAVLYCAVAGAWLAGATPGASSGLPLALAADGVSAAGTTQGTATQLAATVNNITTVGAGSGVNLPPSARGASCIIANNGANALTVYPFQGATDTINGNPATTGVQLYPGTVARFDATAAGAWTTSPGAAAQAAQTSVSNSDANTTLTAAQITGGTAHVDVHLTGAIGAGRNLVTPTAAQIVAAMQAAAPGSSYVLRVVNAQGGAFAFTMTAGSSVTLSGPGAQTIAQNTWREWLVTVTATGTPAVTMKSLATGTYS